MLTRNAHCACPGTEGWFAVVEGREPARRDLIRRVGTACVEIHDAAGDPWLIGCMDKSIVWEHQAGAVKAVVIHTNVGDAERFDKHAGSSVRDLTSLASLVRNVPGGPYLIAADGSRSLIQGPVFGQRDVFHASAAGAQVASSSAVVAARCSQAGLDYQRLALRLATVTPPLALASRTVWDGVSAVPVGSRLTLGCDNTSTVERWWSPPSATLSLRDGADHLRDALRRHVSASIHPGEPVAVDLAGLDSTSLCFLAAEAGADIKAVTVGWEAAGNEDVRWGDISARELKRLTSVTRLTFDPRELPGAFTGIHDRRPPAHEPTGLIREREQLAAIAAVLREHGVSTRVFGHGGDHVTQAQLSFLAEYVRQHPVAGTRKLLAFRASGRWSMLSTFRHMSRIPTYGSWLRAEAERARRPGEHPWSAPLGWEPSVRLPPWASRQARQATADLLHDAARTAEPFGTGPAQHARVHAAYEASLIAAQLAEGGFATGLPIDSPFCDDQVVEACLSTRPEHTHSHDAYKPLLKTAMAGIVPATVLQRTTKDHASVEWYRGLATQRKHITGLFQDSPLVDCGLVDGDAYRRALQNPELQRVPALTYEYSLAVETWLRDVADGSAAP